MTKFAWLRAHAPVFWHADGGAPDWPGFWAVTRHDDIEQAARHPEIFSSARRTSNFYELPESWVARSRLGILNADPPQHTRLRGLVNRGFTPRMIGRLEDRITQICGRLLADVTSQREADFVTDIAEERKRHPRADIVTRLLQPDDDKDELTVTEFGIFFTTLIVAGNETTRNAASGGMLAFFQHPDQWRRLLADPALIPTAAEFDIGRDPNPHLAFGFGPHFCLGRHLAALELRVLLQAIAELLPAITLDGEVSRLRSNFINGIKHMPVRFPAAAS